MNSEIKSRHCDNSTWLLVALQVTRLEGQVMRYKTAAENSEKVEDELKAEKRKLQREVAGGGVGGSDCINQLSCVI